ncbi:MAG: cupin domain-containing protein [Woeseia sp.]
MKRAPIAAILLFATLALASADDAGFIRITPDELIWQELSPGLSVAIIEGDPAEDGFYIMRAKFAPGILSAPHYHPNDRFVTVLSGTWWTGIGPVQDNDSVVPMRPGSYMKHPAHAAHYDGSMDEEVIVEIKGMGPAPLIYVDSSGKPIE